MMHMGKDCYYITTPIYYVNDKPHIGHAYTTILADVLARYHRMLGEPTFFLTGTDEHGQKVAKAAREAGISSQEQADHTVVRFQELWRKLEITHDDFIRTTEVRHKKVVAEILQDLYDQGEIYRDEYDGWYCTPCERFFMERDLVDGCCPECHRPVEQIREANYFFRMSRYRDWLIEYIEQHPEFIQPDFRANETLGFLRRELNDLCISRPKSRLDWGIELPFDKEYVTYVWFDALVNYISAIGYRSDDARFAKWWPADYHLIGKDILTTHTVYWPTMLKAMGVPLPKTIFAHGWWLIGQSKMSKSLGNVVNPMDMADKYGVDPFRYFLMAEMTLGQDASFTEEGFVRRFNADLANDLGNLVSRVLKMIRSYCGGRVPVPEEDALKQPEEKEVWQMAMEAVDAMEDAIRRMKIDTGLYGVFTAIRATNRYLEQKQPWSLAKQKSTAALGTTLYTSAEILRVVSALLYPVMPGRMELLRTSLGLPATSTDFARLHQWGVLTPGNEIKVGSPLFPRVATQKPQQKGREQSGEPGQKKDQAVSEKSEFGDCITMDDFMKVKLRTAKILNAEKIEGADKLLKLDVMLGEQRRQLVAGIAQYYAPDDIIGKTIVVVANLKPATIRGVQSNGMLLAAHRGENMKLITVDGEMASGAEVR
jgi:methionyl-tRNA synthetase